ncbi:hypothetical protein CTI12_AA510700 [Artemisia annua]|uniref:Ulp1 protease family, C-terminal catalytic domain-containing protein n=1 Tax=Artemisia annua TaxID=35608 RepID=A0A2U1LB40_ARTAN|nr:hypothetical protein CTI12_AA510700 [Artemisia annua]
MDIPEEISQSKENSAAESDQNKLPNVDYGKILNPTPLSRFNPFDDLAKKTSPVKPRFNPYDDLLKKKSPAKKKPTNDVSKAAKPAEFEVNVQGKASVDQGKETSDGKKSTVVKDKATDKGSDVLVEKEKAADITKEKDKKLKLKFKVTEPVKTTPKSSEKKSAKVLSEASVLRSKKPVQEETQPKRKLGLAKVDDISKKQKLKVQKDADEKKKRKRGDSSGSDKGEDITPEDKGKKKMKGKGPVKIKKDNFVKEEDILPGGVMKQLMKNLLKNSLVKGRLHSPLFLKNAKAGVGIKKAFPVSILNRHKQRNAFSFCFSSFHSLLPNIPLNTYCPSYCHPWHKKYDIQKFLVEIGFSSYIKFDISKIPARLGRYVVENFDAETCRLKLEHERLIEATVTKVHELLGIPIGGQSLLSLKTRPVGDDFEKVWVGQFEGKSAKQIRVNDIANKLIESKEVDFLFKVNFLTLFTNTMGMVAGLQGEINFDVVKHLLYLDSTNYTKLPVPRTRPAIKHWSSFLMSQRHEMELKEEYIGMSELYDESELPETEGFVAGCSSDTSYKKELLNNLEEKLAVISNERACFEELLATAGLEFPEGNDDGNGDDKKDKDAEKQGDAVPETKVDEPFSLTQRVENHLDLIEEWFNCAVAEFYYQKCVAEGTMEPMGVGIPGAINPHNIATRAFDASPSPAKRLVKLFSYLLSPYMNKKTRVELKLTRLEWMLGNSIFAMRGEQLIRKVKPRIASLKWKTKNNIIDCGVFTMLHMDNYTGEAPGKWDCGLVAESKEQSNQLRVLRFKFSTKILLHKVNVHAARMYELALEFDKLPPGEKMSIIISAVRNRDERDRKF